MRCCVPFCKNAADNVSTSEGEEKRISFHVFPSEVHLRAAWLRALGKQDSQLPDSAVVCSQHFLNDEIYESESGRQIVTGAIPSTVQVCIICLDTDSKLFLMSKHKLKKAYENLTGSSLSDPGNLKQTVCVQCAQRLINFSRFRDKSLRARALMMDLVEKHELITRRHIKLINRTKHQLNSNMVLTTLGPDHCDLHILEHSSEDKQTELEETEHGVVMKTEGSDDCMSVDEDMGVMNEDDNNVDDFVQDSFKYENISFQCTLCFEEFAYEHAYMQHMCMHLQDSNGDGECDMSQVCKPHTAVGSSSSHSSLITENKQPGPSSEAHAADTLVAGLSASVAAIDEDKVHATEGVDTTQSERALEISSGQLKNQSADSSTKIYININRPACSVVQLYDISSNNKKVVPRRDESLIKTRTEVSSCNSQNIASNDNSYQATRQNEAPVTEHFEPVTNAVKVSKTLPSKTDCLNNDIDLKCYAEEKSFTCHICRKLFERKSLLVKHIKTHTEIKPFTCKICQYKCKYRCYLTRHMQTHTGEKPFSCKFCDYKCIHNSYLVRHVRTHTGEKPYSCMICNYKSDDNSKLLRHIRTHTGEKPYTCNICNNKFAQNSHLVRHKRIHSGEKPYICDICNNKFAQKSELVSHTRTHTGEKPYFCKICSFKCARSSDLVTHVRTHTGEKPYICTICNSKFAKSNSLVMHMRTHTGEKPYSCNLCEFRCASNSNLSKHMGTHSGKKPSICKICNSKFAHSNGLVKHMRTHTGEKPFTCSTQTSFISTKSQ